MCLRVDLNTFYAGESGSYSRIQHKKSKL